MYVLGIDIGTTNAKAVIVSEDRRIVAEGTASYSLRFLKDGGVEQHPDDWWEAVCRILQTFWRDGVSSRDVKAIAVSGHGCALTVVDEEGNVLRPSISSLDIRCSPQTKRLRQSCRELILKINGNDVGAFNFEPKLLWLKETEPQHYDKMPCFLTPTSYINFKLTGSRKVNLSDGGIGMAFDRRSGKSWSPVIIEAMGLDEHKFPELLDCSEPLGEVTRKASEETGLPEGIPVLAGGEDTSSAALSVGVTKPGMAYVSLGTQGTVGVCADRFFARPEILGFPHVLPGLSLLSGSMSTCGGGMNWFVREWCRDLKPSETAEGKTVYDELMEACSRTTPGAKGLIFLPYLSGELHPILDEKARGVFIGLTQEHTREDMARAVMEGAAHAIAHNLQFAETVTGPVSELRAVGGPAKNPIWCQAIADISQRPVKVVEGNRGAPLGNAVLALGYMTKTKPDEIVSTFVKFAKEYEPGKEYESVYRRHHYVYTEIYNRIKDLYLLL